MPRNARAATLASAQHGRSIAGLALRASAVSGLGAGCAATPLQKWSAASPICARRTVRTVRTVRSVQGGILSPDYDRITFVGIIDILQVRVPVKLLAPRWTCEAGCWHFPAQLLAI